LQFKKIKKLRKSRN